MSSPPPPTSPPEAARPKTRRNISFAHANWTPRGAASLRSSSSRPSGGLRSVSFAHPQPPQQRATAPVRPGSSSSGGAVSRPGGPPRALSFCDTRFAPSGPNLALRQGSVSGPFAFMNPTTAIFDIRTDDGVSEAGEGGERARIRWNAREFRKGRHIFILPRAAPLAHRLRTTSRPRRVLLGLWRMVTVFPYWDVSWLIGVCFTVGCGLFIACGLFYWLPVAYPRTEFAHEEDVAGGVVSFVGATLFQVGAVLLMLESWNDRAETKFGGAVEAFFGERFSFRRGAVRGSVSEDKDDGEDGGGGAGVGGDEESGGSVVTPPVPARTEREALGRRASNNGNNKFGEREWQWLPSWHDVRTHYVYEIGFLASATMSLGATIFYLCGILALPGIHLSQAARWGAYYLPYLVGGVLFALASLLYVLETQPDWRTPQPRKIGWHVGVFNLIGGVGWTLAAAFGYCGGAQRWCAYQSELSLIWASVAFTFGSALQWYESLDKYVFVIED